eukprot:IDg1890t1
MVGSMHQLVQRVVREQVLVPLLAPAIAASNTAQALPDPVILKKEASNLAVLFRGSDDTNWVASVIRELFDVIESKFSFSKREYGLELLQRLQKWTPCVQRLIGAFSQHWCPNEYCETISNLFDNLVFMLVHLVGNAQAALPYAKRMLWWTISRLLRNRNATSRAEL